MADIIGRIAAPHKNRREIQVFKKIECIKLPFSSFPITCEKNPKGIAVTLVNGENECEASFHRYEEGHFYIGSPKLRLNSSYADKFTNFLSRTGLFGIGEVKLSFQRNRGIKVYISRLFPSSSPSGKAI